MDPENIETASQYVNNLLLSRGLLRDGNAIDFSATAKSGQDTVVASIINLVHDLILRRDREGEHLSSLSQALQTLRTNSSQHGQTISRLEAEKASLQRDVELAKSQARKARLELKSLESKNKAYKEDIQRLRTSVGQIRAQCANDVRKRDAEIARFKKHVDIQRSRDTRNSSSGPGGVTIIDPTTGKAHYPAAMLREEKRPSSASVSLRHETNDHLTALSTDLSESNEALTSLIQNTISTLRLLQGLPADSGVERPASTVSQRSSSNIAPTAPAHEPLIQVADVPNVSMLTDQLSSTISSLRSLLTEPSFVPLEEVEVREAELVRLRAGWEKMEARWREAVGLMNSWRQRMLGGNETGTINMDDIRRGMELAEEGLSVAGSPEQKICSRKRDSSGSEISIDTYADTSSEAADTSILSAESNMPTEDVTIDGELTEAAPRLKKLRFDPSTKPEQASAIFPAPQVLRPKSSNSRSPTRRQTANSNPVEIQAEATPTPTPRGEAGILSLSRPETASPDVWMQPESAVKPISSRAMAGEATGSERHSEQTEGSEKQDPIPQKAIKRTVLPRRMLSKRRSTLTPSEIESLAGGSG